MKSTRTNKSTRLALAAVAVFGIAAGAVEAFDPGPGPQPAPKNRYIGADKCANCHDSEAKNQFSVWEETGHSHAWEALASDEALRIAKELGIDDPQKSERCVKCHVTGHGQDEEMFKKGFEVARGVQCETCHGPGESHQKARFKAAMEEDDDEEGFGDEEEVAPYADVPAGEIEAAPAADLCLQCHNTDSPTYKPFCYIKRINAIRHIDPRKPRTEEELAALKLVCKCENCETDGCPDASCGVAPDEE